MFEAFRRDAVIRACAAGIAAWLMATVASDSDAAVPLPLALQAAATAPDSTHDEAATAKSSASAAPEGFTRVDRKLTYTTLEDRLTLRAPFNAAKGKIRVISFLSPTCPRCLAAVADIQRHFLAKNDSDDFRMFAVWVPQTESDTEASLLTAMQQIPDPRVQHYWDAKRVLNAQLLDAVAYDIQMRIFDLHLFYDGEAIWEKRLPRPGYLLHEVKGLNGPPWDIRSFVREVEHGLNHEPFTSMSQ